MATEEEVKAIEQQDTQQNKTGNNCAKCNLCTEIPVIPMYAPYNVRDLQPGKTYLWCRYFRF